MFIHFVSFRFAKYSSCFFGSELRDVKENSTFAEITQSMPEHPTVLKLAVDYVNLALCDSRDLSLLCLKYIFFSFYRSVRFKAKEHVRTCKDYVIGREITTVLKIAVGSVSLTRKENRINLIVTLEKAVDYSLGVELFVPFMPRHILEKVPD